MNKPHVVIVGAGFAGMRVAKQLSRLAKHGRINVTLVNKTNYFLFTPLLHEVATGGLTPTSVTEPLRTIFAGTNVRLCLGAVDEVDCSAKAVSVSGKRIPYDYLVLASGAVSHDFGVPGVLTHARPLKTLADAIDIREAIIATFERAAMEEDAERRRRMLAFVVVGAGATGVEMAAELSEFIGEIGRAFRGKIHLIQPHEATVALVGSQDELLPGFPLATRRAAKKRLHKMGIQLRLGTRVTHVAEDHCQLNGTEVISASVTVWTAGVLPSPPSFSGMVPEMKNGRCVVDRYLRITNDPAVFALGDVAYSENIAGEPIPMLAQVAAQQATTVAKNIRRSLYGDALKSFRYRSKGMLVSLGQWSAAGHIGAFNIRGRLAWWIWRTVYLFKFGSFRKQLRIASEWTVNLFYARDITSLR